jgi:lipopolysaccharide transport system permease protein
VPSDGIPYALFAFTGTAIWTTFQRALNDASVSFVNTGAIISKVYFPRLLVPVSSVITAAIDFIPLAIVLLVAVIALGVFPGWPILAFPFLFLLILTMALSVGLWVTVLDSILRDLRFFIPYGMQMVFYACPIMYSATIIPERWQALYRLNPLVSILEGFRWSLVAGAKPPGLIELSVAILIAAVLLLSGLVAFARLERIALDRM